jgi:hypothetical protein
VAGCCRNRYSAGSAPSDGGNDADFVPILEGGGLVLEEANILAVHVNVQEAAQFAGLVTEASLETGVTAIESVNQAIDAGGVQGDAGLIVGELLKGGRDQDLNGHGGEWKGVDWRSVVIRPALDRPGLASKRC